MNFKDIHVGQMIEKEVTDRRIEISRICNFMKCSEEEVQKMYPKKSLDAETLLKWSKLLEYDFFRLYSQHLILYSPPSAVGNHRKVKGRSSLPRFRKNIYTRDVIDFILEQIQSGKMTKNEVVDRYRIPKTTLYKWIDKYSNIKKIKDERQTAE